MSALSRWRPLLAVLPLAAGLGLYGQLWRGWAAGFEARLAGWFPGRAIVASGFPYRLEAELADVLQADDGVLGLRGKAGRLRLNQGPWRPELTVLQAHDVQLAARLGAMQPMVTATTATASLKRDGNRIDRLSLVLPDASGQFGIGPPFRARRLELHGRELGRDRAGVVPADPANPVQGQLVLAGMGVVLGAGQPIDLDGTAALRGAGRLGDYRRWAAGGGSVDLVLAGRDATGELFRLDATLVPQRSPDRSDSLRLAGTITTVCPATLAAALAGTAPPAELRLRAAVRLAIDSALPAGGPVMLAGVPADLGSRARRGQLPPCPRLR
jgi:hypothetical protein